MTRFSSINSAVSRSNTISDQWFVTWQSPRPALTVLKMILSNIFGVVATHASKNILKPLNKKIFSGFTLGKFKTPFWSVVSWQSLLSTGKWSIPWTIAVILSGFTLGRVEAESQAAVSCLLTTTVFIWKYLVLLQQTRLENESLKKHSVVSRLVKLKRNPEQWSLTWQLPFELKQFRQHLMKNIHFCWHEHVNCKMSHFLNSGSRIQWFHACKSWKGISSSGVLLSVASPDCSWHLVKMICFVPPDSAGECLDFSSMYSVVSRLQMLDRGLV